MHSLCAVNAEFAARVSHLSVSLGGAPPFDQCDARAENVGHTSGIGGYFTLQLGEVVSVGHRLRRELNYTLLLGGRSKLRTYGIDNLPKNYTIAG